jgi:hypothetical protein
MANNTYAPDRAALILMLKMLAQNTIGKHGVTRQDIAHYTGLNISTVNTYIRHLARLDIVEVIGKRRADSLDHVSRCRDVAVLRLKPKRHMSADTNPSDAAQLLAAIEQQRPAKEPHRYGVCAMIALLNCTPPVATTRLLIQASGMCEETVLAWLRDAGKQNLVVAQRHGRANLYAVVSWADRYNTPHTTSGTNATPMPPMEHVTATLLQPVTLLTK